MQDPFAGRERLNQMTPEELKFRNANMSGQVLANQYRKDLTQAQIDEESRKYYRGLNKARYSNENEENQDDSAARLSPRVVLDENKDDKNALPQLDVVGEPEKQQSKTQLPLGWSERMNQVTFVSDLNTDINKGRIMAYDDIDREGIRGQLEVISRGITAMRENIDKQMDLYMTLSEADDDVRDDAAIVQARKDLKEARAQLAVVVAKENELKETLGQ